MFDLTTKQGKVFRSLVLDGERLTEAQARKRFGVGNLRAEVTRIRQAGYPIYSERRMAGNNQMVTDYRLGTPSRRLIAAGYKAIAAGLV